MNARTAIITGASSGLGLECARALLRSDPSLHVVLAVRIPAVAPKRSSNAATAALHCNHRPPSLTSVRAFAEDVRAETLPPLHARVRNAGVQVVSGTEWTEDGVEMTFGVCHLGHFALVQGLLGELVYPARIVVVSSGTQPEQAHRHAPPTLHVRRRSAHPRTEHRRSTAADGTRRRSGATCSSPTNSTAGSTMA